DHQILLVGEINRYDRANGHINRYKINKDYEEIGKDLNQFKEQYVKSLVKIENSKSNFWRILLVSGIIVAGVLTMRFSLGSASGGEDNTGSIGIDE
ncbi:MAG: hypothetical protein ACE5HX_11630, partial [bacterium]